MQVIDIPRHLELFENLSVFWVNTPTKFDIVQNCFSSGLVFRSPSSPDRSAGIPEAGALDHESPFMVRHHVSLKRDGNWVRPDELCTNYYYKELKMGEAAARKHRQDAMQKYAIQVDPSKDYPLRRFEGKDDEIDGQIGYGKGSMVFHLLRQAVGKDAFFSTLREFSKRFGGKQAAWRDIQQVFEEASGKSLGWFFSQWLDRPGGPRLKVEQVGYEATPGGYRISGEVVQEGDIYRLSLPVEVDLGNEKRELLLEVSKRREPFSSESRLPGPCGLWPSILSLMSFEDYTEIIPGFMCGGSGQIFVIRTRGRKTGRANLRQLAHGQPKKGGRVL
jgi:hypothetical protein